MGDLESLIGEYETVEDITHRIGDLEILTDTTND